MTDWTARPGGDKKGGLPVSLIITKSINQSILPLIEREAEQWKEEEPRLEDLEASQCSR